MNKKVIKIMGVLMLTFALIANLQYAILNYGFKNGSQQLFAQDIATGTGGNGASGLGCYTRSTVDCGNVIYINGGCNFTGTFGNPTMCTGYNCGGTLSSRHCVQAPSGPPPPPAR